MTSPATPAADGKRGGPPPWFLIVAAGSLLLGLVLVVLAALGIGVRVAGPGATLPPTGQPAEITHALVVKALQTAQFQVRDPLSEYRPPEGDLEQAIELMKKHRALEDTIERARHYGAMARDALEIFETSPIKTALLETVDFCISRAH